MSKTPSAILSDALTSFNRAATLAFTAAQDQARKDVTHATTDAREARKERDEAVNALHASRLEEQAWKEDATGWKAVANQAELTIKHHLETIAQLREEATQWKSQCLRLEETSRQEAKSWKEQFLRVEQERLRLAQRVEELVAEQLSSGGTSTVPYTPIPRYSAIDDLSASARLQRAAAIDSLSPGPLAHPPSKFAPSSKTASSAARNRAGQITQLPTPSSENQRSTRQRAAQGTVSQPSSTSNGTRQILIRRVHAVVEVPVKEESVDQEDLGSDTRLSAATSNVFSASTSSSAYASAHPPKTSKAPARTAEASRAAPRSKRKASMKRTYVEIDDVSEPGDAGRDPNQSDAEEYQSVSDDGDDELLMGVEVNKDSLVSSSISSSCPQTNCKEVYGMKRVPKPVVWKSSPSSVKKQKLPPVKKTRPSTTSKS